MKILVDGDILVYRCGFAAEKTRYTLVDSESGVPIEQFDSAKERNEYVKDNELEGFEVGRERLVEPLSHALQNVKSVMNRIFEAMGTDNHLLFLSSGKCFRNDIATIQEYKANRKDAVKPVYYRELWDYIKKEYNTHECESIEADDALALCQTDDTVIVSIDKDLLQVPGKHYNWVREEKVLVTPEVGLRKLYQQVLTGDPTDNIPGIRGIGEVRARALLADVEPTKKALASVCTEQWDKFLHSDAKKPVDFKWDEETKLWEYSPWWLTEPCEEYNITAPTEVIAAEVFHLVKVGGRCAKEALTATGEEVPAAGA